jgi:hypothetical protein
MVEIVLTAFNNEITPAKATVIADPVAEATVEIEVSLSDFTDAFQFKTSDDLANPLVPDKDIHYYTDITKLQSDFSFFATNDGYAFNPALGKVTLNPATAVDASANPLTNEQLAVVNDYMRDLAKQMFGSPHLTYLFSNDEVVQEDIVTKCKTPVNETIRALLSAVDKNVSELTDSDSDGKYTTDQMTSADNICRQMFLSLATQVPDRFRAPGFSAVSKRALPLVAYDSIRFRLTLNNSVQNSAPTSPATATTGWTAPNQVRDRVYNIRMILVNTPSNPGFVNLINQFTDQL